MKMKMKKLASLLLALGIASSLTAPAVAAEKELKADSTWVITDSSHADRKPGSLVFDGDKSTYWHTYYKREDGVMTEKAEGPHWVEAELPENTSITGMIYTPRQDSQTGIVNSYKVLVSANGKDYTEAHSGTFDYGENYSDLSDKKVTWNAVNARKVKIQVVSSVRDFAAICEITLLTDGAKVENVEKVESGKSETADPKEISLKDIVSKITYTGDENPNKNTVADVNRLTDGVHGKTKGEAPHWETAIGAVDAKNPESEYYNSGKSVSITIELKEKKTFDTVRSYARCGWDNQRPLKGVLSVSDDGKTWTKSEAVSEGGLKDDYFDAKMIQGGKSRTVTAKFVKLEISQTYAGVWSSEEITLVNSGEVTEAKTDSGEDNKSEESKDEESQESDRLPRDGWTVTASSTAQGANAEKILDGNENTYWHSYYRLEGTQVVESDPAPFYLDFTLPSDTLISGVVFTPRKDRNSGRILAGNLYVSDSDDGEWFLLRENMTFEDTAVDKNILFGANISVKRIRFEVTGTKYGTMAEFYALKPEDNYQTLGYEEFRAMDEQLRLYEIDRAEMTASYDGDVWTDHTADKVLDGSEKTCWQCTPIPQWQSGEEYSVYFNVDMGDNYKLKQIDIVPRQTPDSHGCWKNFNVLVSTDGENFTAAKENITAEENIKTRTVVFDNEVNARFVRFEIKEGHANRASCAEIKFYQSKAGRDEYMENSKEKYVLIIGSSEIAAHVGGEDKTVTLDTAPFIGNGSAMMPLRGLLEVMGAAITWKGETEEIEIKKDAYNIRLQIWNRLVYVKDPKYQAFGELRFTLVNEPVIKDSRTFIPLRFVSEQLGYDVSWDPGEQKITITKNM